jgi:hypothetical protein
MERVWIVVVAVVAVVVAMMRDGKQESVMEKQVWTT